ncbi:MAG: 4-(cytidine 5'-diphospho)-2-C-methyl-D-erythritol kinase, partial [Calditrichaeota bacterium]
KINIGLRVVGRRSDGFHDIETFFQQIDLYDELQYTATMDGRLELTTNDPHCPANADNLVLRAARALKNAAGTAVAGCRIHLDKKIPIGAGLGGGSSDAAATLTTLNELWQCGLGIDDLTAIAGDLGSDVAFFLQGGFAFGSGRGERLKKLSYQAPYFGLLIFPGIFISTKSVYEKLNLNLTISNKMSKFSVFGDHFPDYDEWQSTFINDLESAVFPDHPVLSEIKERLFSEDAFYAAMSGSGSTMFGLYRHEREAQSALKMISPLFRAQLFRPIYT